MLSCIVWRWRRFAAVVLAMGLVFGSVQAWSLVRNVFDDNQPHFGELAQVDITGEWRTWRWGEGARLTVHEPVGCQLFLRIDFESSGCLDQWGATRTGWYADGVLSLNEPVKEYNDTTYDRLYSLRVEGMDYLVPDVHLGRFLNSLASKNETEYEVGLVHSSFSKKPPPFWQDPRP